MKVKKLVGALVNIIKTFTERQLRIEKKMKTIPEIAHEGDTKRQQNFTNAELILSL